MAKDYKKIGEGDVGLNTGGMGAISPVPFVSKAFKYKIEEKIIKPTIKGLEKEEIPFRGFIFIGLIKVEDEPKVIEYNVRMGDPETQVVMPMMKSSLFDLINSTLDNSLESFRYQNKSGYCVTIVLASDGYPGNYEKGHIIKGLDNLGDDLVFHAGTSLDSNDKFITSGGRVLNLA